MASAHHCQLFKMVLAHASVFSQKPSLSKILSRIIQSFDFLIKKKMKIKKIYLINNRAL